MLQTDCMGRTVPGSGGGLAAWEEFGGGPEGTEDILSKMRVNQPYQTAKAK